MRHVLLAFVLLAGPAYGAAPACDKKAPDYAQCKARQDQARAEQRAATKQRAAENRAREMETMRGVTRGDYDVIKPGPPLQSSTSTGQAGTPRR